ncbi:MAG: response regulator [Alphaproteobacteria bacterium]
MAEEKTRSTILIVDDEPINVQLIWRLLEEDYDVLVATNGPDAIDITREKKPALVLLDVVMPDMIGFDVCEQLQADAATKDVPVIFLTSLDDPQDKVIGFAVGGVDYITKPFFKEEVLARVRTHLTLHALRSELKVCQERLKDLDENAGK